MESSEKKSKNAPIEKKFGIIVPSYFKEEKGGSELQSLYIGQELQKRGWNIHYIRESNVSQAKCVDEDGISLYSLPKRREILRYLNYFKLKKIMRKIDAQVWYCRGTRDYLPAATIFKKKGAILIWACSHDFQLGKKVFNKKEIKILNRIVFGSFFILRMLLFKISLKFVNLITVQNETQHRLLGKNYLLDGVLINNAHPLPSYSNSKREDIILWIGRLQTWKRPELFVEIANKFKGQNHKFMMIGRRMGSAHFLEESTNQFFYYMDEMALDEINLLLEKSKLLVCTSDNEGFPNTFIQAWMRGVPVVSLWVDPNEFIKKNDLGRISHNMRAMHEDIQCLMENEPLWKKMSENCEYFAKRHFNIVDTVDVLEKMCVQ